VAPDKDRLFSQRTKATSAAAPKPTNIFCIALGDGDASPLWRPTPTTEAAAVAVGFSGEAVTYVIEVIVPTLPLALVVSSIIVDEERGIEDVVVTNDEDGAEVGLGVVAVVVGVVAAMVVVVVAVGAVVAAVVVVVVVEDWVIGGVVVSCRVDVAEVSTVCKVVEDLLVVVVGGLVGKVVVGGALVGTVEICVVAPVVVGVVESGGLLVVFDLLTHVNNRLASDTAWVASELLCWWSWRNFSETECKIACTGSSSTLARISCNTEFLSPALLTASSTAGAAKVEQIQQMKKKEICQKRLILTKSR
jgi:hypothetical protein